MQNVSSHTESIFHLLSPFLTLIFALSLMLLIFVMFNLFVKTEEITRGLRWGDRWVEITKLDPWGQIKGLGGDQRRVVCPLSLLLLLLQGLNFSAGCQRGRQQIYQNIDLNCVVISFAPCNALMLLHSACLSVRGRMMMDRWKPLSAASCLFCIDL